MFYFKGDLNKLKRCQKQSKTNEDGAKGKELWKQVEAKKEVCPQHASRSSLATCAGELDTSAPELPTAKKTVIGPGIF